MEDHVVGLQVQCAAESKEMGRGEKIMLEWAQLDVIVSACLDWPKLAGQAHPWLCRYARQSDSLICPLRISFT